MDRALFQKNSAQKTSNYAGLQALVADEFENSRVSIRQMLQGLGIEHVDQTSSGKGVVDACRARQYDLVLCDFRLTGNKNGQQVLEELRELKLLKPSNIFIIVSAETSRDVVMGIMESQPDEYLSKPFTQAVLARRLERQFQQAKALSKMKGLLAKAKYQELIVSCLSHIKEEGRYTPWCKKTLVDAFIAIKEFEKAAQICQKELANRDLDWALLGLAKIDVEQLKYDSATIILEKLLRLFPQTILAYDLLAKCYEKLGRLDDAQATLDDALKISPRIHRRQKQMAEISLANGDTQTALKASQQTVRLGLNSIFENPDDYIQLVDIVSESASDVENSTDRKRLLTEATQALTIVGKRFSDNENVKLRKVLAESRFLASQGQKREAKAALELAKQLSDAMDGGLQHDLVIEFSKTLYQFGEHVQADKMLTELLENESSSEEIKQKAADFLDEPVSISARAQAKSLNKEGLSCYTQKNYSQAIDYFKKALEYSYRHPGLNLNLVQTMLKMMEIEGVQRHFLKDCEDALNRLNHVGPNHKQFKRLNALKDYLTQNYQINF